MPIEKVSRPQLARVLRSNVAAGATDDTVIGADPFPVGRRLRITLLGAADVGSGDGIASVVTVRWGSPGDWRTLRVFTSTGTSFSEPCSIDLVGDGTKKLQIRRNNRSASPKAVIAWIEATRDKA